MYDFTGSTSSTSVIEDYKDSINTEYTESSAKPSGKPPEINDSGITNTFPILSVLIISLIRRKRK